MKKRNVTCDLAPITCERAPTTLIAWSRHVAIRACIPTTSARPGIGNRAFVIADRMGAVAFVELNTDGTPIGPLTVQKNMRVIKSNQSIDPSGTVLAPSQSAGVCTRCAGLRACLP